MLYNPKKERKNAYEGNYLQDNIYQGQDQTKNSLLNSNGKCIDWSLNNVSNNLTNPNSPKKLYRKREESRFAFAKKLSCNLNVIKPSDSPRESLVPDYVSDVICKKISRHTFFKKFENYFEKENQDFLFVEKHLKPDDSWSKFIISNMSKQ